MSELRSPRMTRMRTIKPEFFKHEALYDLEQSSGLPVRMGLAGLWVCCDRDGLFEWQPRRLKIEIFPYDNLDFGKVLDALLEGGFIQKYEADGKPYGCIPTWHKHQSPNGKEPASGIPRPSNFTRAPRVADPSGTGEARSPEFAIVSVNGNVESNVEGNVNGNVHALQAEPVDNRFTFEHSSHSDNHNSNQQSHSHPQSKPAPPPEDDLEWEFLPVPIKLARLFYESLPQETRDAAHGKWESLWSKDLEGLKDDYRVIADIIEFVQKTRWKKYVVRAAVFVEKYDEIKADWKKQSKKKLKISANDKETLNLPEAPAPKEFPLTSKERVLLGRPEECDHGVIKGNGCGACEEELL